MHQNLEIGTNRNNLISVLSRVGEGDIGKIDNCNRLGVIRMIVDRQRDCRTRPFDHREGMLHSECRDVTTKLIRGKIVT